MFWIVWLSWHFFLFTHFVVTCFVMPGVHSRGIQHNIIGTIYSFSRHIVRQFTINKFLMLHFCSLLDLKMSHVHSLFTMPLNTLQNLHLQLHITQYLILHLQFTFFLCCIIFVNVVNFFSVQQHFCLLTLTLSSWVKKKIMHIHCSLSFCKIKPQFSFIFLFCSPPAAFLPFLLHSFQHPICMFGERVYWSVTP